jgi:hypothetical protein
MTNESSNSKINLADATACVVHRLVVQNITVLSSTISFNLMKSPLGSFYMQLQHTIVSQFSNVTDSSHSFFCQQYIMDT